MKGEHMMCQALDSSQYFFSFLFNFESFPSPHRCQPTPHSPRCYLLWISIITGISLPTLIFLRYFLPIDFQKRDMPTSLLSLPPPPAGLHLYIPLHHRQCHLSPPIFLGCFPSLKSLKKREMKRNKKKKKIDQEKVLPLIFPPSIYFCWLF